MIRVFINFDWDCFVVTKVTGNDVNVALLDIQDTLKYLGFERDADFSIWYLGEESYSCIEEISFSKEMLLEIARIAPFERSQNI